MPARESVFDYTPAAGAREVEVLAFGQWLQKTLGSFDVLKMDCEGSEWEFFRRTNPSASARIQGVIDEVHTDPQGLSAAEEFGSLAETAGFRTVRWDRKCTGLYVGVRNAEAKQV
jgi:hypothetical protein